MNMIYKEGYGCVFSLDEYDELTFAPLYENGSINLNEFLPVEMEMIDMDDMEVFDIRNQLIRMNEIYVTQCCIIRYYLVMIKYD